MGLGHQLQVKVEVGHEGREDRVLDQRVAVVAQGKPCPEEARGEVGLGLGWNRTTRGKKRLPLLPNRQEALPDWGGVPLVGLEGWLKVKGNQVTRWQGDQISTEEGQIEAAGGVGHEIQHRGARSGLHASGTHLPQFLRAAAPGGCADGNGLGLGPGDAFTAQKLRFDRIGNGLKRLKGRHRMVQERSPAPASQADRIKAAGLGQRGRRHREISVGRTGIWLLAGNRNSPRNRSDQALPKWLVNSPWAGSRSAL